MSINISDDFNSQDYEVLEDVTIYLRAHVSLGDLVGIQEHVDRNIFADNILTIIHHNRYGLVIGFDLAVNWDAYHGLVEALEDIEGIVSIISSGKFRENETVEFESFKADLKLVSSDTWQPS